MLLHVFLSAKQTEPYSDNPFTLTGHDDPSRTDDRDDDQERRRIDRDPGVGPAGQTGGSAITGYKVSRNGIDNRGNRAWSTTVPTSARSQVFSWLNGASSYNLSVQAITAAGTGPAATVKITMGKTPPSIPLSVAASKNDTTKQAIITWTAPASSGGSAVMGYVVTRDGTDSAGNGPRTVTVSATTRNTTFTALKPRTTYTFTVKATNAAGSSQVVSVKVTTA